MNNKIIDIKGQIFNEWVVLEYGGKNNNRHQWLCKCSCGKEKLVDGAELKRGKSKSCGHDKKIDLTGKIFGEWTVLKSSRIVTEENFKHYWLCQCSCGEIKEVAHGNLANGNSTNCGHLNKVYEEIKIGDVFNEWTVIGDYIRKNHSKYYLCRCSCGKEKRIEYKTLYNGTSSNCGHINSDGIIAGMIFGRLTVIEFSHKNYRGMSYYSCQCACGNIKAVQGTALKNGNSSSCGCYRKETSSIRAIENQKKMKKRNHSWYFYDKNKNKIDCRSSFEVLYWNYHYFILDENIQYEPRVFILDDDKRYMPDFYFPDYDKWIETKGSFFMSEYGIRQKEKINILKKDIDIFVLFWKDIAEECQLKYKSVSSYFYNANKNNIKIEDYLAEMLYL